MPRLRRSDCSGPGITRRRAGRGFAYYDDDGERVDEREVLERIRELGIPPAWKDVWICPYPNGHLQATGVDAAGRKQYRYHDAWRTRRDAEKFEEMTRFAKALPRLREQVEADLHGDRQAHARARAGLRRAAAGPRLLPHRHRGVHGHQRVLRPGHDAQGARARSPRARWSSTTRPRAASGASRPSSTRWRRTSCARSSAAAAAATSCWRSRPARTWVDVRSDDINAYLKAGDRRRLLGQGLPHLERDRDRRARAGRLRPGARLADTRASARSRARSRRPSYYLGNTPAVCRASYIDPRVFDAYRGGLVLDQQVIAEALDAEPGDLPTHHPRIERAVLDLIDEREHAPGVERLRRPKRLVSRLDVGLSGCGGSGRPAAGPRGPAWGRRGRSAPRARRASTGSGGAIGVAGSVGLGDFEHGVIGPPASPIRRRRASPARSG